MGDGESSTPDTNTFGSNYTQPSRFQPTQMEFNIRIQLPIPKDTFTNPYFIS
jgi:hypothetical protein